jgi:hypothetical protein
MIGAIDKAIAGYVIAAEMKITLPWIADRPAARLAGELQQGAAFHFVGLCGLRRQIRNVSIVNTAAAGI